MSAQEKQGPPDPESRRRSKPAEGGESPAAGETPPPPPDRPGGLGYTFRFARLDPKSAFDFEDVADK